MFFVLKFSIKFLNFELFLVKFSRFWIFSAYFKIVEFVFFSEIFRFSKLISFHRWFQNPLVFSDSHLSVYRCVLITTLDKFFAQVHPNSFFFTIKTFYFHSPLKVPKLLPSLQQLKLKISQFVRQICNDSNKLIHKLFFIIFLKENWFSYPTLCTN